MATKRESVSLTEAEKTEAVTILRKGWATPARPHGFQEAMESALSALLERFEVRRKP